MQDLQLHSLERVLFRDRNLHMKMAIIRLLQWCFQFGLKVELFSVVSPCGLESYEVKVEYDAYAQLSTKLCCEHNENSVKIEVGKLHARWRQIAVTWDKHQRWTCSCSHMARRLVCDGPLERG